MNKQVGVYLKIELSSSASSSAAFITAAQQYL